MDVIPKWISKWLSVEGVGHINASIAAAEQRTAGEIVPMIVRRSTVAGHVWPIVFLSFLVVVLAGSIAEWQARFLGAHPVWAALIVIGIAMLSLALSEMPAVRRLCTSPRDIAAQVNLRAEAEFFEADLNKTAGGTGILIYISLEDHCVVVVGDKNIASQIDQLKWNDITTQIIAYIRRGDLTGGLIHGVGMCGGLLAQYFPRAQQDINELPDKLIIKE